MTKIAFDMPQWSGEDNENIKRILERHCITPQDIDSFFSVLSSLKEISATIGKQRADQFVGVMRDYIGKVGHVQDTVSNSAPQQLEDEINNILRNV